MEAKSNSSSPPRLCARSSSKTLLLVGLCVFNTTSTFAAQLELTAKQTAGAGIYEQKCQSCHGANGEGVVKGYEKSLTGDATVGELTKLIAETMPEGEPEECVSEEAESVAEYIHFSFYSEAARIRNRPPRIELTRLTARQLRQSLADLYASQSGMVSYTAERGLHAEYFAGAKLRRQNRKIDRNDTAIEFDFGHEGPGEGVDPKDFSIRWRGGVLANETGSYQIVIRSTCAFLCYLGDYRREFINNRVQSGDKTEFRQTIQLTAGRVYPLQIDFYQRKRKTQQPPAKISLSWKGRHGIEEIIPARNLVPTSAPATFSLQAKLPPDDRSYGFERGSAVDAQWDQSTTDAALEFSESAVAELWPRYKSRHKNDLNENREIIKTFLGELVEVAFRGPLDDESRRRFIDDQVDSEVDDGDAIRRSLLVSLKSARFLYPRLDGDRSRSQRVANRLALAMFDSLPSDSWLRQEAAQGQLETDDQVRSAARRMVQDFRARGKARDMMYQWLGLHHIEKITKDEEKFPNFDELLIRDLQESFDAFIEEILWSEASRFQDLFLADWSYTTDRMAKYYGDGWSKGEGDGPLVKTSQPDVRRAGILTHPYLMSGLAYHDSTSPIHRGVFLTRHVLGRTIRPPAEAFTPLSPDLHPDLTTRERVKLQTSPANCQVCHIKINGLGFTLEKFDAVGRFRESEGARPIDASGRYTNRQEKTIQFVGARELAQFVSQSEDAHRAFVRRAFLHLVKQPPAAFGSDTLDQLLKKFRESNYDMQELFIEIAVVAAEVAAKIAAEDSIDESKKINRQDLP